jgi:thioesterase domain-containing protein
MGRREFERYLHSVIPLSQAMQVAVLELGPEHVLLRAPLAPNLNHRGTVFGGSASTLATLAAWGLLYCRLEACEPPASVVLQSSSMSYLRPIAGAFSARAELSPDAPWSLFLRTLERRGKARISVTAELQDGADLAGRFVGEFVALSELPLSASPRRGMLPVA